MESKLCKWCNTIKPFTEFHKSKREKDGHERHCKACRSRAQPIPYITPGMKKCTLCKEEKPHKQFQKAAALKSGLSSWCKECSSKTNKAKRKPLTEERLKKAAELKANEIERKCTKCGIIQPISVFRKAGSGRTRGDCKTCADKYNKPARRERHLKKFYGLSVKDYEDMVLSQTNLCAICGEPEPHIGSSLAVDHNHTTGKVRQLLCSHCNLLLGHAKDSIDILKAAIQYLIKHN